VCQIRIHYKQGDIGIKHAAVSTFVRVLKRCVGFSSWPFRLTCWNNPDRDRCTIDMYRPPGDKTQFNRPLIHTSCSLVLPHRPSVCSYCQSKPSLHSVQTPSSQIVRPNRPLKPSVQVQVGSVQIPSVHSCHLAKPSIQPAQSTPLPFIQSIQSARTVRSAPICSPRTCRPFTPFSLVIPVWSYCPFTHRPLIFFCSILYYIDRYQSCKVHT
jgi:hypothetical protein